MLEFFYNLTLYRRDYAVSCAIEARQSGNEARFLYYAGLARHWSRELENVLDMTEDAL